MQNLKGESQKSQQPERNGAERRNPPKFDNKPLVVKDYNIIVFFIYKYIYESFAWGVGNIFSNYLLPVDVFGIYVAIAYFAISIGIGVLASIFSSRKYMKV